MLLSLSSKKLFLVRNKELMAFPLVTLNQEIFKDNLIQDNWESGWGYYLIVLLCWDYLLSNEKSVLMRYSWTGEWALVKYLWGHQVLARWKSWKEARTDDLQCDVLIKKKKLCALHSSSLIPLTTHDPNSGWRIHQKPHPGVKTSTVSSLYWLCCYFVLYTFLNLPKFVLDQAYCDLNIIVKLNPRPCHRLSSLGFAWVKWYLPVTYTRPSAPGGSYQNVREK